MPGLTAPASAVRVNSNVRPRIQRTVQAKRFECAVQHHTTPRAGRAASSKLTAVPFGSIGKSSKTNDLPLTAQAQPLLAGGSRSLTQQAPAQQASHASSCTPGKAQSALPSCRSGAAAAGYGSRHRLLRAPARSTAGPWSSSRQQRGAGSARRVHGNPTPAGLPSARPNPSLKLTRYGRSCKPGPRQSYYRRVPGLQALPPRAA